MSLAGGLLNEAESLCTLTRNVYKLTSRNRLFERLLSLPNRVVLDVAYA